MCKNWDYYHLSGPIESRMGTKTGQAGNRTEFSSLPVIMARPGQNTASKTSGGQYDVREYSTEVIYNGSDQDSGDGKDSQGFRQGGTSEREGTRGPSTI